MSEEILKALQADRKAYEARLDELRNGQAVNNSKITELSERVEHNDEMRQRVELEMTVTLSKVAERMEKLHDTDHYDQHDWLKQRIQLDRERIQFWREVRKNLATAGVIGTVSAVLSVFAYAIKTYFHVRPPG